MLNPLTIWFNVATISIYIDVYITEQQSNMSYVKNKISKMIYYN